MASNFLKSTTTLLLIVLSALSIAMAVKDTDGNLLRNGGAYYIIPQSIGFGGGLSTKPKTQAQPCPLYITPNSDEGSLGIPVTIRTPYRITFIPNNVPVSFTFKDNATVCIESLRWQVIPDETTGRSYVATGGTVDFTIPVFKIVDDQGLQVNQYKIKHIGGGDELGLFGNDSLLGITEEIPLPVAFKKADNGFSGFTRDESLDFVF